MVVRPVKACLTASSYLSLDDRSSTDDGTKCKCTTECSIGYLENGDDHVFPPQVCMTPTLVLPGLAGFKAQEVAMLGCKP